MRISVIIPAYNSSRWLPEAIDSALAQTMKPDEIIIVDDGSTDDTQAVIRRYGDRVRSICQPNGGISKARNAGIRMAGGSLIAFLDADDVWSPDILRRQAEALEETGASVVHTDFLNWNCKTGNKFSPVGQSQFQGECYRKFFWGILGSTTSAFMVRRECFDVAGLFDEDVGGAEDEEMWTRLARQFRFAYIAEPLLLRRLHDSNITLISGPQDAGLYRGKVKSLRDDSDLCAQLGKRSIEQHLGEIAFTAGYGYFDKGDNKNGRKYLMLSLRHGRFKPWTLLLIGYSLLPRSAVSSLRALKSCLG